MIVWLVVVVSLLMPMATPSFMEIPQECFYRSRELDPNPRFSDVFVVVLAKQTDVYLPSLRGPAFEDTSPPREWYPNWIDTPGKKRKNAFLIVLNVLV